MSGRKFKRHPGKSLKPGTLLTIIRNSVFLKAVVPVLVIASASLATGDMPAPYQGRSSGLDSTFTDPTGRVTLRFASRDWITTTYPEPNNPDFSATTFSLHRTAKPKDLPCVLISYSSDRRPLDEMVQILRRRLSEREEGVEFMGFALSGDDNCKILVFENKKSGYSEIVYLATNTKGWVSVQETFLLSPADVKSSDPEDTAAIRSINDNLTINR